ncbi:hypothetical protein AB0G83_23695 [Streptomyces klenkii]|uniref:hypothetical protein n=1 Tax=Streptomyces klenkii TaxID=1420899 RepID=UPI0033C05F95
MSGREPGFAFGRTVTVHRSGPPGRDAYGNDIPGGRDTVADTVHVLLPAGAAVTATDRLAFDGHRYEVHGPPQRFHSPLTGACVTLVAARRTTG